MGGRVPSLPSFQPSNSRGLGALLSPRDKANCRAGAAFSLIEVLIAVVILSTGIVLVLGAMNTALLAADRSRDTVFAVFQGRQILDAAALRLRDGIQPGLIAGTSIVASPWEGATWEADTAVDDVSRPAGASATSNRLVCVKVSLKRAGSPNVYVHRSYAIAK